MKITAVGKTRSLVGEHDVAQTSSLEIEVGSDGEVRAFICSNEIGLHGQFNITIQFSAEEAARIHAAAIRAPVEMDLYSLRKQMKELRGAATA